MPRELREGAESRPGKRTFRIVPDPGNSAGRPTGYSLQNRIKANVIHLLLFILDGPKYAHSGFPFDPKSKEFIAH